MTDVYDLIVIGGGPGGYCCAIRAAQQGLKTACVERRPNYGGTCLNVGCIPSKALLHASHAYHDAADRHAKLGVVIGAPRLDLEKMLAYKDAVVDENVKGIRYLLRKNKIEAIHGTARIVAPGEIVVAADNGDARTWRGRNLVIASGSEPTELKGVVCDEKVCVTSTGALSLDRVPKTMAVIGGGYIGLELGSVWSRLGAEVTVIEYLDRIAAGMDGEIAAQLQKILTAQGLQFRLGFGVRAVEVKKGKAKIAIESREGGKRESLDADIVLVAAGRRPCVEGLNLDGIGVRREDRGRIVVDERFASSVPGIYAIGDVIAGPMLAHKAEDEGAAVADIIAGVGAPVSHDLIPGVVYTDPEAASVGATEEELKSQGIPYRKGTFPFTANARARIIGSSRGMVKILACARTDRVLGVHMLGPAAGDMIAEAVTAMEFGASAEDIALTCHPHPSLSETVREAALAVSGRAIHI